MLFLYLLWDRQYLFIYNWNSGIYSTDYLLCPRHCANRKSTYFFMFSFHLPCWSSNEKVIPKLPQNVCLLLLLLSHLSRVRLCATPETAAHQAPPSLGFSRQECWSGFAITFSSAWKWKVKGKSLSSVWLPATPWTAAHQAPPYMGFSRQEYWSGVPFSLKGSVVLEQDII